MSYFTKPTNQPTMVPQQQKAVARRAPFSVPVGGPKSNEEQSVPHRIDGVDLNYAEQIVRRLILRQSRIPTYCLPPPLLTLLPDTLQTLFDSPHLPFASVIPPPVDPAWRAHEAPGASGVPVHRAARKRVQIVALLRVLVPLLLRREGRTVVYDFCGGCGHVGIVVAALFPLCDVTILDVRDIPLGIAKKRAKAAKLTNLHVLKSTVEQLPEEVHFDVAVGLHACGAASDAILAQAAIRRADIVIAPCCVGSLCNATIDTRPPVSRRQIAAVPSEEVAETTDDGTAATTVRRPRQSVDEIHPARSVVFAEVLSRDEYMLLARAADFGEANSLARDQWRVVAKAMLEHDRLLSLRAAGYKSTYLVKMRPEDCTPKNDILVACFAKDDDAHGGESDFAAEWPVDHLANGVLSDFADASVLTGLAADSEVAAVQQVVREAVCAPGSVGVYMSPCGGGKRARKLIHAVAHSMALVHESVGRGAQRRVTVRRHVHWPLYFERFVGVGGPVIDDVAAKLLRVLPADCAQRRKLLRGAAHHITLVSPKEIWRMPEQFKRDHEYCVGQFYEELVGSSFSIVGVGKVTKSLDSVVMNGKGGGREEAFFAVVNWPKVQTLRRQLGLPSSDLHITLGFRGSDVHGVRKDTSTLFHEEQLTCSPWLMT